MTIEKWLGVSHLLNNGVGAWYIWGGPASKMPSIGGGGSDFQTGFNRGGPTFKMAFL